MTKNHRPDDRTGIPPKYDDYDIVCPHPECPEGYNTYHDEHCISSLIYHLSEEHEAIYNGLKIALGARE